MTCKLIHPYPLIQRTDQSVLSYANLLMNPTKITKLRYPPCSYDLLRSSKRFRMLHPKGDPLRCFRKRLELWRKAFWSEYTSRVFLVELESTYPSQG